MTIASPARNWTLFIDGQWQDTDGGTIASSIDPADGTTLAQYAVASVADVDRAVASARTALADPRWGRMVPAARAALIWRFADLIEAHGEELAMLESRDQGQPATIARAVSVPMAVEQLRYNAGWCTKLDGSVPAVSVPDALNFTKRQPLGVCVLLPTWNFPLMSAAGKLAPALAAGNTVVLKPSDYTPMTALRITELALQAGFPPGVINCVTGDAATAIALVEHPDVAAISFTGSTVVGRDIARRSADRFVRLTLELGGKAPSVITEHADVDAAVQGNLQAALLNSGQVCAAYTRFYVHTSIAHEFVEKLSTAVESMVLGPGVDASTQLGPLVSERQVQRVAGYVAGAVDQGATLVTGGYRPEGALSGGAFYAPTVFADVQDTMTIAREEVFGPVLSVLTYDDEQSVVARANDSEYALGASVWTRDIGQAHRLSDALDAGSVFVNMLPALDVAAPWGGFKSSGTGKEMGHSGILDFTREKSTWVSTQ